jgi:hypothetical protein
MIHLLVCVQAHREWEVCEKSIFLSLENLYWHQEISQGFSKNKKKLQIISLNNVYEYTVRASVVKINCYICKTQ